ncbi:MAG: DUF1080 domain-containing protein [Cyclobacteriaceae bacterium]|nr:DUF1080 domain-containing protein [Cyclobacteriaceae bacterium]
MKINLSLPLVLIFACSVVHAQQSTKKNPESTEIWEPQPRIITPGNNPGDAPSDATILFDGKNLDNWVSLDGTPAKWMVSDGAMTVVRGARDIRTKQEFGDFQLHIEWRTPPVTNANQTGQNRGNSGIFLQGRYEVQVLDNFDNKTYANGQAASVYKQHIPLVNASRKPGEWQVYDIIYTAPRFNNEGRLLIPAKVTVMHNGVLVQHQVDIWGPTEYIGMPVYQAHGKGPIQLQDHGDAVSFRNIWIREL